MTSTSTRPSRSRRRLTSSHEVTRSGAVAAPARVTVRGRRRRELAEATFAVMLLGLLEAGLPVLLWRVGGNPLPEQLPSLTGLGDWLLQPDSGQLLLSALITLAWTGWAWFSLAVLAEATAQLPGRPLPRLPAAGPPRRLAARLVAAAVLLLPAPQVATFATAPSPVAVEQPHPARIADPAASFASPAEPGDVPQDPQPAAAATWSATTDHDGPRPTAQRGADSRDKVYEVRPPGRGRRDSLWAIAERHLGDPLRWSEIARLNHGRLQPDGRRLTDPHWIYPGWRLRMPADATGLPTTGPEGHPTGPAAHQRRDLNRDEQQHHDQQPHDENRPDQERHAQNHHDQFAPPARAPSAALRATDEVGGTRRAPIPATAPAAPTQEAQPTLPVPDRTVDGSDRGADQVLLGALAVGGGLLAAGLVTAVGKARILQRRSRPSGTRLPRPAPELAAAEVRLRVLADPDDRDFLDLALRSLSWLTSQRRDHNPAAALPELHAARLSPADLELYLAAPVTDPPPAYTASDDGRTWTLDRHAPLPLDLATARTVLAPYPGLVPVGHDGGEGLMLVDLEGVGSIGISGDPEQARQLVAWIAAELALGGWSDYLSATAVALPDPLAALGTDRLQVIDRLDPAAIDQLANRPASEVLTSRMGEGTDPVLPEFLLLTQPPTGAPTATLDRLGRAAGRTGVGVVVAGDWPAARWTLRIDPAGRLTLPALGATVTANRLDDETITVMSLLTSAANEVGAAPAPPTEMSPPDPALAAPEPCAPASTTAPPTPSMLDADDDLDAAVEAYLDETRTDLARVAIIGPVRVQAPGPVASNRASVCTELIAYLTTHPRGVADPAKLDLALWPDRAVLPTTRNEVIARARKWLGHQPDGALRLPHRRDGSPLRLSPGVLADWDLFQRLARRGLDAGQDGTAGLATALRLVRGKPFENVPATRYAWVAETFLEQDIPTLVVDVAHKLAGHRLAAGDPASAREAARIGQLVDQYDERLWRDLIEAEHRLGNTNAIRQLVADLMTVLEVDVQDELQDETDALIQRLLPRRAAS